MFNKHSNKIVYGACEKILAQEKCYYQNKPEKRNPSVKIKRKFQGFFPFRFTDLL